MTSRQRTKAIIASAIFPGVGQFIAGEPIKGGIIQLLFIGLLFGFVIVWSHLLPLGLFIPLLVWLYSIIDLLLKDVTD